MSSVLRDVLLDSVLIPGLKADPQTGNLQNIFVDLHASSSDNGQGSSDSEAMNSEMKPIVEELQDILERLESISASTFNVAELVFRDEILASAHTLPNAPDIETLLGSLVPGSSSTRRITSVIRSLQLLLHDLDDLLAESRKIHPKVTTECERAVDLVNLELGRLVTAVRGTLSSQTAYRHNQAILGVRSVDFSIPPYPTYQLAPITTATVIIITVIHCFMNVSRENSNFILRAIRGLLQLAVRMQEGHQSSLFVDNINRIPTTLETSIQHIGIQAQLVFYAVCPKCSALYPESEPIPDQCSFVNISNRRCNAQLLKGRRRGQSFWQKPCRRYSHQPLEVWLANFLNRPGIEDLIETVRPNLQVEECTDFWGASYLCDFPGQGQRSFFDSPVENLRLAFMIYHDFFNPFGMKTSGKNKSIGVIMLVCLNLPHEIRYNRENVYTVSVIPGPSGPTKEQINHFMRPVIENLKEHYNPGVWVTRTHKYPNGRHVRSAAMIESMDLLGSRAWCGIGYPDHTILCSVCSITQEEIDQFGRSYSLRTMQDHIQHVQLWMNSSNLAEQEQHYSENAARYSEMLRLPWWSPFSAPIAPMHWIKNILNKQLHENMGWSWKLATGIPSGPKETKPITYLELEWGQAALRYCSSSELVKTSLNEPLLRFLCLERGIYNVGLPSRRLIRDLEYWRQQEGIIDTTGALVQQYPIQWAESQVSIAKAKFYLTKAKNPEYLMRKALKGTLEQLCSIYHLSTAGTHHNLAERLVDHHSEQRLKPDQVPSSTTKTGVAVLGKSVLEEVVRDIDNTIIPGWLKPPPKLFGTTSHGKIGSEEYKSLALISFTLTLVRIWHNAEKPFVDRLNHFLHLTQAVRVLSYQSISKRDIQDFQHHYSMYVGQLKELYPHCTVTPTQHLGTHIPHFLDILGPATRFNESPSEMFIGMIQDIPMNWRFGELEYTLHKEFVAASNLQALLGQPQITSALGEVGTVVEGFLEARYPGHTGVYGTGWKIAHPATPCVLSKEIYTQLSRFYAGRQMHAPTQRQFLCTKVKKGNVVYQPETTSIGNSQIIFEDQDTQEWAGGRIESILYQSELTGSLNSPQLAFLVRRFKLLNNNDRPHDPYLSHPIIGASGSCIAVMFYEDFEPGLPVIIQPKDVLCHIATCRYHDPDHQFSAPCIAAISLNLKHSRM